MLAQAITLALLPCLLAYACFSDLFTMRISNRVCLFVLGLFPVAALMVGMPAGDIGLHLLAGAAVIAVSFTLFAFGWVGGGDAKLVAAAAVWFGFDLVAEFLAISCVLGGGLTLAILYARQHPLPAGLMERAWIAHLHERTTGIPYGIALGVAALIVLPHSAVWKLAI
ncbi:MAG: A24 family peptidase [Beijerinckiaceae bacterium]